MQNVKFTKEEFEQIKKLNINEIIIYIYSKYKIDIVLIDNYLRTNKILIDNIINFNLMEQLMIENEKDILIKKIKNFDYNILELNDLKQIDEILDKSKIEEDLNELINSKNENLNIQFHKIPKSKFEEVT